jgi:Tol biopolymer transport system component
VAIDSNTRLGQYEIQALIGVGGMGEVYRARDTSLKRDVARKVLPSEHASDADRLARFQREAEVLASLNHPNIAHIYGVERGDGTTALAMELVEGPTLAERIAQGRIPAEEALRIAAQIADALEAAHERGIVHRDLKPANIKVRSDGTVKVLDFGIAKALDARTTAGRPAPLTTPAMTEAGIVLGTAAYMSPEQARGKPVDQRTDIWAFGCLLYEMLTGQAAFLGEDVTTTLARVLQGSADLKGLPPEVSAPVRRTLELCFEKDARKRIADMRDVKLSLAGAFAMGAPTSAPRQTLWRWALPAGLLVAGLLAGIYLSRLGPRAPPAPAEPAAPLPVSRFVITPPPTAPLASQGGLDVTISPDGKRIAYIVEKPDGGDLALYVRELDALESRPLVGTERPAGGPMNPFFSPDGKSVGFSAGSRGIIIAAIDGRPSVKLLDPPQGFAGAWWGADNTVIYTNGPVLQRVSASGGGKPEALMAEQAPVGPAAPVLLPGGHAVLYHARDSDRVAVLDLDTGNEKTVVEGGSNPAYVDTGHVVFARGDTLMAVPFKAAELAVTGEPVALVQGVRRSGGGAADFALSANGTLVYVPGTAEAGTQAAVVWVDRAGKVTGRAVPDLVTNPRDPRVSPDGKRLLLVTGSFADGDLWSYDLGGRPPIPLALPGDNRMPVWSPDGTRVAFLVASGSGPPGVFSLPADGSALTPQPLNIPRAAPQVWSADGELFVMSFVSGSPDIIVAPIGVGGEVRKVVASEFNEFDPALSPNGRWLAYASNRTGRDEIWVQGYPDGVPVRVSSNGGYEPLWSADGRELFYRQASAMMAAAVETGAEFSFATPQELFKGNYLSNAAPGARGYDVAHDGRFLMILPQADESRAPVSGSIVVVQNFTEELKQRVRPSAR